MNFMKFNVYERIGSSGYVGFTSKERDRSGQLKQSTRHLRTAGCLSFPAAKEIVR